MRLHRCGGAVAPRPFPCLPLPSLSPVCVDRAERRRAPASRQRCPSCHPRCSHCTTASIRLLASWIRVSRPRGGRRDGASCVQRMLGETPFQKVRRNRREAPHGLRFGQCVREESERDNKNRYCSPQSNRLGKLQCLDAIVFFIGLYRATKLSQGSPRAHARALRPLIDLSQRSPVSCPRRAKRPPPPSPAPPSSPSLTRTDRRGMSRVLPKAARGPALPAPRGERESPHQSRSARGARH